MFQTVLIHYNPSLPLKLVCDASHYGVGAVIAHMLPSGEEKPIALGPEPYPRQSKIMPK